MISSEEFSATADILEFYLYQLDQSSFNQNYVGDISYLQHLYDSTNVGLSNYREDAASMTGYLDKDKLQLTIGVLLSCLYLQIGNHNRMQFSMQRSLLRLPYSVINDEGLLWQKQKEIMQLHIDKEMSLPYRFGWHGVTVHYVTYASEETKELKNLLYSAAIAGVDVKVK